MDLHLSLLNICPNMDLEVNDAIKHYIPTQRLLSQVTYMCVHHLH